MADREQPFGEGNGRNSCNLSPLHIDLKSKKGRIVANPNVRLRKELPDALAGHLHPVGGSATLNFPPEPNPPKVSRSEIARVMAAMGQDRGASDVWKP